MSFKNIFIALLILLFSAGVCSTANAQEWRYYKWYHHDDDGPYHKERYYYRPYHHGFLGMGWRRDWRDSYAHEDNSFDDYAKYVHTYKNYDHEETPGYHRYYHMYKRYYYDRYYNDNYHSQVDDNK